MTKYIFCLGAARSGGGFLGNLLNLNLPAEKTHFQVRNLNFGTDIPDISTLLDYNFNNMELADKFWEQKIKDIKSKDCEYYVEINPMLLHVGFSAILEAFAPEDLRIIVLQRDFFDTIHSYHKRFDLAKIENQWLWYLDPTYPRNIVDFPRYKPFGLHGTRLWYLHEAYTRIEYYKQKYTKHKFFEIELSELTYNAEKFEELLKFIGLVPEKITVDKNLINQQDFGVMLSDKDRDQILDMIAGVEWDKAEIVKRALKVGVEL